jgi:hypothetical protein
LFASVAPAYTAPPPFVRLDYIRFKLLMTGKMPVGFQGVDHSADLFIAPSLKIIHLEARALIVTISQLQPRRVFE